MRITGGEACGRSIAVPAGVPVRPTASKVRQAFFNILGKRLVSGRFLDLCAGSGLMGMEALSRGAERLIFVEQEKRAAKAIENNLKALGFEAGAEVICQDLRKLLPRFEPESFDVIFADPPYKSNLDSAILALVDQYRLLAPAGLLVIEHMKSRKLPSATGNLKLFSVRSYGQTSLSFYNNDAEPGRFADGAVSGC